MSSRNLPLSGANMLLLIRDRIASNFSSLCGQFGVDPDGYPSMYVRAKITQLEREGLIAEVSEGLRRPPPGPGALWAEERRLAKQEGGAHSRAPRRGERNP